MSGKTPSYFERLRETDDKFRGLSDASIEQIVYDLREVSTEALTQELAQRGYRISLVRSLGQ